VIWITSRRY